VTQTRTEVDIPTYIPTSMQRGGMHDPLNPRAAEMMENGPQWSAQVRAGGPTPSANAGFAAGLADPRPLILRGQVDPLRSTRHGHSRWSIVTVPRFRDIKSWASDQRIRMTGSSRNETVPDILSGPYRQV
jgi:hypothetical protein